MMWVEERKKEEAMTWNLKTCKANPRGEEEESTEFVGRICWE